MEILTLVFKQEDFHKGKLSEIYGISAMAICTPEKIEKYIERAKTKTFEFFEKGLYTHCYEVYRHKNTVSFLSKTATKLF